MFSVAEFPITRFAFKIHAPSGSSSKAWFGPRLSEISNRSATAAQKGNGFYFGLVGNTMRSVS